MRTEESKNSDVSKAATSRSYGPFPTPYPYPNKTSSSMAPVFMHEPYQGNHDHAAEAPPTPTYDASPSPVSPHNNQEYPVNQVPYSNQSGSQSFPSSYYRSPISLPNPSPSYSQSKTNDIRDGLPQESPSYHPSSSSWSHDNGYSNSPPQRLAELGAPSWPLSSPLPSAFTLVNQADSAYNTYSYSSHTHTAQSNSPSLYSTSYPMSSALGPLPSLAVPESRGGYLSPLTIPDRSQGTPPHSREHRTSAAVLTSDTPENFHGSLAPLNVIQRPKRYRREPADEKYLQRLNP